MKNSTKNLNQNKVIQLLKTVHELTSISNLERCRLEAQIKNFCTPLNTEPIAAVLWVPYQQIKANNYNPNKMASVEKKLLLQSMLQHGLTAPLVVTKNTDSYFQLIDGYHRFQLIKKNKTLLERLQKCVPVVQLDIDLSEQIVASIRHNRARGKHQITEMSYAVQTLYANGWTTEKIKSALGMDADEVLRLSQFSGLGELFKNKAFSKSWK